MEDIEAQISQIKDHHRQKYLNLHLHLCSCTEMCVKEKSHFLINSILK